MRLPVIVWCSLSFYWADLASVRPDGFNGLFIVHTDAGNKCVTIDTIRAGGYNIQALHLRVLVKVK